MTTLHPPGMPVVTDGVLISTNPTTGIEVGWPRRSPAAGHRPCSRR
jgi:hypothetical protein